MICKDCHNRVPDKDNFCVSGMQAEPLSELQNHPDRSEPGQIWRSGFRQ